MTPRKLSTPRKGSVAHRLMLLVDRSGGPDACWPFDGKQYKGGYCHMQVDLVGHPAHVWAFLDDGGELTPEKPFVLHSCDNPPCCNPRHLRAGSAKDNASDRDRRQRNIYHIGSANGSAKLTEDQVRDIRQRVGPRGLCVALADEFGVSHSAISNIRRGIVWRHVA